MSEHEMRGARPPAVAGTFYPAEKEKLAQLVDLLLESSTKADIAPGEVRALMVPHAGYTFSGACAAHAYTLLQGRETSTVVLLCNSHTMHFSGVALDTHSSWVTPLGEVFLDSALRERLIACGGPFHLDHRPHQQEHALEVQLPFLQRVLPEGWQFLPLSYGVVNEKDRQKVAHALVELLSDTSLILASSDMTHYPSAEDAERCDPTTLELIVRGDLQCLDAHLEEEMARKVPGMVTLLCGVDGVRTLLHMHALGWWQKARALCYRHAGMHPTLGDRHRVVGYGAVAFLGQTADGNKLSQTQGKELLEWACRAVVCAAHEEPSPTEAEMPPWMAREGGCFVTLRQRGALRGCMGRLPSTAPLSQQLLEAARSAAIEDPRFTPLHPKELAETTIEVSILSPLEPVEDWTQIVLGEHGVVVQQGPRAGLFLPQVATETGWSLEQFLGELCQQKAGLPREAFRSPATRLSIFTAQVFAEDAGVGPHDAG